MKTRFALLAPGILLLGGCSSGRVLTGPRDPEPLRYTVDLNDRTGDTFKVTLDVEDLEPSNAVYQFASTAPGTYQVMDIGRFVRGFEALDASGRAIATERVSTNQWRIADPEAVVRIRYEVAETWDTPVGENPIYPMCGTSVEDDHVLINGQAVFGYPAGMQARPLRIRIERPGDWSVGTALATDASGSFLASDYDHVVDSPILMGRLSKASLDVRGSAVDIFTYSKTDRVHSDRILDAVRDILEAEGDFLGRLPVDRYAFLFHFEDLSTGAWEHSYSSTYTFAEADFEQAAAEGIPSVVAHEFLHIVTPLNIHSEIIERFNFVEPTPSEHVWLYEGTTEWEAQISQLRGGLIDLQGYLDRVSGKLIANDGFDADFSLSDISLQSYTPKGQREWGNIYQRGAVVAGLLDLRLLAMSGGTRGLREVILELSAKYGPDRPFDEGGFFDEFARMTYPEIRPFFENYVRDTKPLPIAEAFAAIGVSYAEELVTGEKIAQFGMQVGLSGTRLVVTGAGQAAAECGVREGDLLSGIDDLEISLETAQASFVKLQSLQAGEPFTLRVERGGETLSLSCEKRLVDQVLRHALRPDPDATPQQLALREAWMTNLPIGR